MLRMLPLLVLSLGISNTVSAKNPNNPCHSVSSDIHRNIELTKSQRLLLREMYATKKEFRRAKQARRQFHEQWMQQFVAGEIERSSVENSIYELYEENDNKSFELHYINFALLDSYSSEEKAQVLQNINENHRCYEENEIRAKRKASKAGIKPLETLHKEIDFSIEQQNLLEEILELKYQYRETLSQIKPNQAYTLYIQEEVDREGMVAVFENHFDVVYTYQSQSVDLWMDFYDTFSTAQREQFLQNAAELERLRNKKKNSL